MARLRDMNITVSGFFSSSTGEAMLYLLEEDRDRTALLIDIGYLCTDVMAVEGDAVIFQKTHTGRRRSYLCGHVAEGLSIPLASAEQIKRDYVYGISTIIAKLHRVQRRRPQNRHFHAGTSGGRTGAPRG